LKRDRGTEADIVLLQNFLSGAKRKWHYNVVASFWHAAWHHCNIDGGVSRMLKPILNIGLHQRLTFPPVHTQIHLCEGTSAYSVDHMMRRYEADMVYLVSFVFAAQKETGANQPKSAVSHLHRTNATHLPISSEDYHVILNWVSAYLCCVNRQER
jgi:hypothetical protein